METMEQIRNKIEPDEMKKIEFSIKKVFDMTIDQMGANYGKPKPCRFCRQPFVPESADVWRNDCSWEEVCCFQCGFDRAKIQMGTPKKSKDATGIQLWDADLHRHFNYELEVIEALLSKSVYIYGPTGTGKTFLGFAICHSMLTVTRSGKSVVFKEFRDIVRKLRSAHKPFGYKTEEQLLQKYIDADVLFVDEIMGAKTDDKPTDLENEVLYDIIRTRNNRKAQTIITSNFDFSQLEKKGFNPRTTSRMAELCSVFNLEGADRRLKIEV